MQDQYNNISNSHINEFLNYSINAENIYTFAIWATVSLIVFAFVYLYLAIKKAKKGNKPESPIVIYIKWALLFASAGFNIFFTYYVFLPSGQGLAFAMAVVMGGVNLAEAYLVKLTIASWRHGLGIIFKIALFLIVPLFSYSLMSASSSFTTMMNKNKDTLEASKLELSAAHDQVNAAQAKFKEIKAGEKNGLFLTALQTTKVTNSRGARVSFGRIKTSCESGGFYAKNYPNLCSQYISLKNGSFKGADIARAERTASLISSEQKLKMAEIIKSRPPEIVPTLLGFYLGFGLVGFIVSLALESAIVGVGFFEEIFVKPTILPANISFKDKTLDWNANNMKQKGLQIDKTPSPHISFNASHNTTPFSSAYEPKQGQGGHGGQAYEPKQGQGGHGGQAYEPKQGQGGHGGQAYEPKQGRGKTPDTGTKGNDTSYRYKQIKHAVENGLIKGTIREIKKFKVDGIGVGDGTARKYRKALIRDNIL